MRKRLVPLIFAVLLFTACGTTTPAEESAQAIVEPISSPTVVLTTVPATEVPATIAPTAEELIVDGLEQFLTTLETAVSHQDYVALQTLMSDSIAVGPWRSEWRVIDSAQLVAGYQNNSIPAPTAVQFTGLSAEEITNLIGQPPATLLGPSINVAATLHSSGWGVDGADDAILFVTEEDGRYQFSAFLYTVGTFVDASVVTFAAPIGLIYRVIGDGVYQIDTMGLGQQLIDEQTALNTNLQISPDGTHAAYYTDEASKLWLLDIKSGELKQLAPDYLVNTFMLWANNETLFVGIFLDPNEAEGPNNGHISTVNIKTGDVNVLDEARLSSGRPSLSPDGETVAFDVFAPVFTAQLYSSAEGLRPFDPTLYEVDEGSFIRSFLFSPAWAANGNQIAWLTSTGDRAALQVYNIDTQTAVQLHDWDPARFGGSLPSAVWSPNSQWLALEVLVNGEEGGGLWLIAADGSEKRLVSSLGGHPIWVNNELLVLNTSSDTLMYDIGSDALLKMDIPTGSSSIGIGSNDAIETNASLAPVLPTHVKYVQAMQDVVMHSGPEASYAEIGGIADGQTALVTGKSENGMWWRVICPDDSTGDCWVTANEAFTVPIE